MKVWTLVLVTLCALFAVVTGICELNYSLCRSESDSSSSLCELKSYFSVRERERDYPSALSELNFKLCISVGEREPGCLLPSDCPLMSSRLAQKDKIKYDLFATSGAKAVSAKTSSKNRKQKSKANKSKGAKGPKSKSQVEVSGSPDSGSNVHLEPKMPPGDPKEAEVGLVEMTPEEVELEQLKEEGLKLEREIQLQTERTRIEGLRAKLSNMKSGPFIPKKSAVAEVKVAESLTKSASLTDVPAVSHLNSDKLAEFSELSAAVDDKLRAFGAAGLSLSCPGLDITEGAATDPATSAVFGLANLGKLGKKSGREAKVTDSVVNTLAWPHTQLNYTNACSFDNIDLALLVAGEITIISSKKITEEEKQGRLELLRLVAYNSKLYQWAAVREFYATILLDIEKGVRNWGSRESYRDAEPNTLYGSRKESSNSNKPAIQKRFFCAQYQTGTCKLGPKHEATLGADGKKVQVEHFCRACHRTLKTYPMHAECDKICPSKM